MALLNRFRKLEKMLENTKMLEPARVVVEIVIHNRQQAGLIRALPEGCRAEIDYDHSRDRVWDFHEYAQVLLKQKALPAAQRRAWAEQVEFSGSKTAALRTGSDNRNAEENEG
jgi:hypothetical protein